MGEAHNTTGYTPQGGRFIIQLTTLLEIFKIQLATKIGEVQTKFGFTDCGGSKYSCLHSKDRFKVQQTSLFLEFKNTVQLASMLKEVQITVDVKFSFSSAHNTQGENQTLDDTN